MAKKVQPVNILPAPSSSDETEDQDTSTDDEQQPQHPSQPQKPQNQSEEESDDSDDETEDDDQPEPQPVVKKPSLPQPQVSEQSDDDSDDNSDDDSDETQNSPSAFTIKPIVSKPVSKSPEQKTPTSKPPRVKSRAKRPAESEDNEIEKPSKAVSKNQEPGKVKGGNSKRPAEVEIEKIDKASKSKKSKGDKGDGQSVVKVEKGSTSKKVLSGDDEVEEKKSIIKWGEKDEDALLVGIIDFKAETGEDVNSKVDTFYEYVKDLLSIDLTRSQLYEKIRRLKKKFRTNVEKWQNGEEPVFSKPHDNKLFELSQKIWGSEGTVAEGNDSKVKSSKKRDKKDGIVVGNTSMPLKQDTKRELFVQEEVKNTIVEVKKVETKDFWSVYPLLCASLESEASGFLSLRAMDLKEYVKQIISKIGQEKARELEDGWKAVHMLEHQLYVKKARLILMQAEAVAEILRG